MAAGGDGVIAVIGDVHGQAAALVSLTQKLPPDAQVVTVGDLFDRGPESFEVYEIVRKMESRGRGRRRWRRVLGNHDEELLCHLQGREGAMRDWPRQGGAETLASFHGRWPPDLAAWLAATPLYLELPGLLVVHAGIRPEVPLARQAREDLLWIREEFYAAYDHGYPATVVFGHTLMRRAWYEAERRMVAVDTGAGIGRRLTAALFEDDGRFLGFEGVDVAECGRRDALAE